MPKRAPEANAAAPDDAQLRAELLQRRRQILGQVERLHAELEWLDTNVEIETMEESQEATMATVLARLDERDRSQLAEIDSALVRMARGDYGRCRGCGEPIPFARLFAMPTTEWCRPCAALREALPRP